MKKPSPSVLFFPTYFSRSLQLLKPNAHLLTPGIELAQHWLKTPALFRQRIFDFWGHLCINLPMKQPHLF